MKYHEMEVGNALIVALSDMNCVYPNSLEELWPDVPKEAWNEYMTRYPETFESDKMRLEIGCYLIRSSGRTILIDTGYGPGPFDFLDGMRGELMANLVANKVNPEDVDIVALSHLHLDHVGWNTTDAAGKLVPTFSKARYLVHEADLEHFRKPEVEATARYPYMQKYVEPIAEVGMLDAISDGHNLTVEVKAIHTPGHTPGHMSILVSSVGERALIQGDVFIHPSQITEPAWTPTFDEDAERATETRRKLLAQLVSEGTRVISCHFNTPGFGRVVRLEGRLYWQAGV